MTIFLQRSGSSSMDTTGSVAAETEETSGWSEPVQPSFRQLSICIKNCIHWFGNTACGFGAIQFLHENPLLAMSNAFFSIDAMVVYDILCDRGFAIPREFAALKNVVSLTMKLKLAQGVECWQAWNLWESWACEWENSIICRGCPRQLFWIFV